MDPKPIGLVGEESTPTSITIKAQHPILPGTYIYIKFRARDPSRGLEEEREVVGIVGSTAYKSILPIMVVPERMRFEGLASDYKKEGHMRAFIVADITGGRAQFPKYPPPPEVPVYPAGPEHLKPIYSFAEDSGVEVGSLVGFEDMRVKVDANALPKHVLVAGTTGSGKSNFVAVLADRVARMGGSVVIFDVHGEYANFRTEFPGSVAVVKYDASINPLKVPRRLLASLIITEPAATKQRRILINALRALNDDIEKRVITEKKTPAEVVKELYDRYTKGEAGREEVFNTADMYRELLKKYAERHRGEADEKKVGDVKDKIDFFFENNRIDIESPNISELTGYGKIVVVDASTLGDEERDFMLKVIAEDLLIALKEKEERRIPPTMLVVEEAHLFLRTGAQTWSKPALQRFAREGRKFGGMLVIVSQRPRALDVDVASQVQNFAFFRLVQKNDRDVVMELTDVLSEEQLDILPSLPPGQGIFIGEWVHWYPAYIKVDLHRGKMKGATPNVVEAWRKGLNKVEAEAEGLRSLSANWEG